MNPRHAAAVEPPAAYWRRRAAITARAAGFDAQPATIEYSGVEHRVWATVASTLRPLWDRFACADLLDARDALDLPGDRVAQLADVGDRLRRLSGFEFRAAPGLVPSVDFFAGLAGSVFASTQYLRWEGSPLYTPEPDVIHELVGHAHSLACPELADLHRRAGRAVVRLDDERARRAITDVFWFTAEFGVLREHRGVRAYGAGLLSSVGELSWFAEHAEIRPLDLGEMATIGYDIDEFQPVLFAADSLRHVVEEVGGFFDGATDDSVSRLLATT